LHPCIASGLQAPRSSHRAIESDTGETIADLEPKQG
jgi:hypothetical protein